jgi:hypothetical protein
MGKIAHAVIAFLFWATIGLALIVVGWLLRGYKVRRDKETNV